MKVGIICRAQILQELGKSRFVSSVQALTKDEITTQIVVF
jgi:hypothetical protein